MKTMTFKTNINCGGCIAKVTPALNAVQGIEKWEVDINNREKILTIVSDTVSENQIKETVKGVGFNIETKS